MKNENILVKILKLAAPIKPGEERNVIALFVMLFMLMVTAYILKPVREELILMQGGSEIKSYATAVQALFLLVLIPIYGYFSRKYQARSFMLRVIYFSIFSFLGFVIAGLNGVKIAVLFYIWLGAYGVLVVSQFWAFASDFYREEDGKRLFALIAFGASSGALVGSIISKAIPNSLNTYLLLSIGIVTLFLSVVPVYFTKAADIKRQLDKPAAKKSWLNAFLLLKKSRYLMMLAAFVLLNNWVNSLGEYLISFFVEYQYDMQLAAGTMAVSKNAFIRDFYSDFFLAVNIIAVFVQFFLVSRCIQYLGVRVALMIIPSLLFFGYATIIFLPIMLLFKVLKIIENSLDYSLLNTVKQVLYLPTTREERYEVRSVIESFGVRLGDVLQGVTVFAGLNILSLAPPDFLWFIVIVAVVLMVLAVKIGNKYRVLEAEHASQGELTKD